MTFSDIPVPASRDAADAEMAALEARSGEIVTETQRLQVEQQQIRDRYALLQGFVLGLGRMGANGTGDIVRAAEAPVLEG